MGNDWQMMMDVPVLVVIGMIVGKGEMKTISSCYLFSSKLLSSIVPIMYLFHFWQRQITDIFTSFVV